MARPKKFEPRRWTDGYLRTLLEQHGVKARGIKMTEREMVEKLEALGVTVPKKRTQKEEENIR